MTGIEAALAKAKGWWGANRKPLMLLTCPIAIGLSATLLVISIEFYVSSKAQFREFANVVDWLNDNQQALEQAASIQLDAARANSRSQSVQLSQMVQIAKQHDLNAHRADTRSDQLTLYFDESKFENLITFLTILESRYEYRPSEADVIRTKPGVARSRLVFPAR